MNKKMRDILFDVKKIAKLRILREKEALERSKNLDDLLKEKNTEKVNYENNLKEIIDKDYIKFKDIHSPKDFLFNFGSNDKRFKEIKKYLKNKGYFPIKRSFSELELIISDGEIDVLLKIEKYKKDYAKLNYSKIKGMLPQFESFRKEIHTLKNKVL